MIIREGFLYSCLYSILKRQVTILNTDTSIVYRDWYDQFSIFC